TALLALACTGLIVPTMYFYVFRSDPQLLQPHERQNIASLSEEIALVLAGVYLVSLLFSLRTHKHLFAGDEAALPTTGEGHQPEWSRRTSLIVLTIATAGVAGMSEVLRRSGAKGRRAAGRAGGVFGAGLRGRA